MSGPADLGVRKREKAGVGQACSGSFDSVWRKSAPNFAQDDGEDLGGVVRGWLRRLRKPDPLHRLAAVGERSGLIWGVRKREKAGVGQACSGSFDSVWRKSAPNSAQDDGAVLGGVGSRVDKAFAGT
jgi:hypothetical protein